MYDEDDRPEPTADEDLATDIEKAATDATMIKIPTISQEKLIAAIAERITTNRYRDFDQLVTKTMGELVEAEFATLVKDRVGAEIDRLIEQGWQKTDEYGVPDRYAQPIPIAARLSNYLSGNTSRDSYSRSNETRIDTAVKEALDRAVKEHFDALIKDAAASLKRQLDDLVTTKIAKFMQDQMKAVLGMK